MAADKSDGGANQPGRITIKERRLACSNSKWDVFFDNLADDRGNEVPDCLVIESKVSWPGRVRGVCVLPIVAGHMVLLKVNRHALGSRLWEAPKGFLNASETSAEAVRHELTEETGVVCAPEHLASLGLMGPDASALAARAALFAATRCTGALRTNEDKTGLGKLQLFDPAEVIVLDRDGRIKAAATLVAVQRCQTRTAGQNIYAS